MKKKFKLKKNKFENKLLVVQVVDVFVAFYWKSYFYIKEFYNFRYQTEGSRGAVKDRSGNGFPIVRLVGYNKAASLQVFIGTDIGRVAPHMFYQACKVAGKNSTQCNEKKVDGTVVIEIDFKPEQDMTITCDCVGILKVSSFYKIFIYVSHD